MKNYRKASKVEELTYEVPHEEVDGKQRTDRYNIIATFENDSTVSDIKIKNVTTEIYNHDGEFLDSVETEIPMTEEELLNEINNKLNTKTASRNYKNIIATRAYNLLKNK